MKKQNTITTEYFAEYRRLLGFGNQTDTKSFFGAKDINPSIDLTYLDLLNKRLYDIVAKINKSLDKSVQIQNIANFNTEHIDSPFHIITKNNILPLLNNQGRRPEQVYFSWMRGFVVSNLFLKAISSIFDIDVSQIDLIGDDDLRNVDTFKRTPKADMEVKLLKGEIIRLEIQSGFMGTNDIKQHKVLEARNIFHKLGIPTIAIHFDLYNGQGAFIRLDRIEETNINWITRQQMEGQTVFNIDQNYFVWKLTEKPIKYKNIDFD